MASPKLAKDEPGASEVSAAMVGAAAASGFPIVSS